MAGTQRGSVAGGWIRSSAALPWREVVTGWVCSGNSVAQKAILQRETGEPTACCGRLPVWCWCG